MQCSKNCHQFFKDRTSNGITYAVEQSKLRNASSSKDAIMQNESVVPSLPPPPQEAAQNLGKLVDYDGALWYIASSNQTVAKIANEVGYDARKIVFQNESIKGLSQSSRLHGGTPILIGAGKSTRVDPEEWDRLVAMSQKKPKPKKMKTAAHKKAKASKRQCPHCLDFFAMKQDGYLRKHTCFNPQTGIGISRDFVLPVPLQKPKETVDPGMVHVLPVQTNPLPHHDVKAPSAMQPFLASSLFDPHTLMGQSTSVSLQPDMGSHDIRATVSLTPSVHASPPSVPLPPKPKSNSSVAKLQGHCPFCLGQFQVKLDGYIRKHKCYDATTGIVVTRDAVRPTAEPTTGRRETALSLNNNQWPTQGGWKLL